MEFIIWRSKTVLPHALNIYILFIDLFKSFFFVLKVFIGLIKKLKIYQSVVYVVKRKSRKFVDF